MACPLKKHQILEVIDLTTDFVAKVLCPKFEEFGSAKGAEMQANVCATLETIAYNLRHKRAGYVKKGNKWAYKEAPGLRGCDDDDDDDEDEDDDDEDNGDDEMAVRTEKMADECNKLVKQIIKVCAKYAVDDKERCANYASTVLAMVGIAPSGAKEMMMHGLIGMMTGEIEP